jgi:DNA polymerase-4
MNETWFHIDMDAFFAAVEQMDHPEWRGKPVIVGALPGHRGVVSTCSYEARRYGVHSAMPISQAWALCPEGIYTPPRMGRYQDISCRIMEIFSGFTPRLIQVSVDEAFLDLSGTRRLLGHPQEVAARIKEVVLANIGLTLSIGIAPNKFLAKIASGYRKPDGLTEIPEGAEAEFVAGLPLSKLWGVGRKTLERLRELRIDSVAELRKLSLPALQAAVGKSGGEFLHMACRGIDPGIYEGAVRQHSVSSETTFEADTSDPECLERTIFDLCNHVMFRMHEEGGESQVVCLRLRYSDFTTVSAQKKIGHPVSSIEEFHGLALKLLAQKWDGRSSVRLVGIGFDQVRRTDQIQHELFEAPDARRNRMEHAVMGIRGKFSAAAIGKASLLPKPPASENIRDGGPVPGEGD